MPSKALAPSSLEKSIAIVAAAFSEGTCTKIRIMTGENRVFSMNAKRNEGYIPYPPTSNGWTLKTWSCAIALQVAPSKQRISGFTLQALSPRQKAALQIIESFVALAWLKDQWPGLVKEFLRFIPNTLTLDKDLCADQIMNRAIALANTKQPLEPHPILGALPTGLLAKTGLLAALRRAQARAPWAINKRYVSPGYESIPAGGESNIKSSRMPGAIRPEEDDIEIRPDQRAGIPYPEWNMWTESFLKNHVAVLERKFQKQTHEVTSANGKLKNWFQLNTHMVLKNRLEDGSDLDVDQFIEHHVSQLTGEQTNGCIFRDLKPSFRDVTTALLLDGSASLSSGGNRIFELELDCANQLCHAMTYAKERHGLFVFGGKTRHRVDVTCIKDFKEQCLISPSELGLKTAGYTRLGAPIRHLTQRLLFERSERRLLIIIGDGLISDEGYEGKYAWADSAHAVKEGSEAGITIFYIGVGNAVVDPLPDVFGARKSTRIKRVEELPRVLAQVHKELIAA